MILRIRTVIAKVIVTVLVTISNDSKSHGKCSKSSASK